MDLLSIIFPIATGAFIGYCTNYIAIKMLFHPYKEMKFLGFALPFTPGVIPKNQPRIAKAVGKAVGENLLTDEDMADVLKGDAVKELVSGKITNAVYDREHTISEYLEKIDMDGCIPVMDRLTNFITDRIVDGVKRMDMETFLIQTVGASLKEKASGTMLTMFVNDSTIASIAAPVGKAAEEYIQDHGREIVTPIVQEEMQKIGESAVADILENADVTYDIFKNTIGNMYEKLVEEKAQEMFSHFDVSGMVEKKVAEMDVGQLEELVMSVMKHELQAVVNLGALLGAFIGALNILV